MTSAVLLGLAIGLRHALDPDHLAAVSTLVARDPRAGRASMVGAVWGLGHGATMVGVGLVAVLLGVDVPAPLSRVAEVGVALLLVALGLGNLVHARKLRPHTAHPPPRPALRGALWRSAGIGVAHGLAGTGLITVAAVAALPDPATALVYLGSVAAATLVAMVACTLLLAAPLAWRRHGRRAHRVLHLATGLGSMLVGVLLLARTLSVAAA